MVTEFEDYTRPVPHNIEMPLCNAIIGVLKGSHVGKDNSIKADEFTLLLDDLLGRQLDVRALRKGISVLRMQGEPICSWCRGYYYLDQEIEFHLTIQSLTDRMSALAAEIVAMSDKYKELYGKTPELNFKNMRDDIDYLIPVEITQDKIESNG